MHFAKAGKPSLGQVQNTSNHSKALGFRFSEARVEGSGTRQLWGLATQFEAMVSSDPYKAALQRKTFRSSCSWINKTKFFRLDYTSSLIAKPPIRVQLTPDP